MFPCKNKLFKKLLFFSFVFLIFSMFCNKFIKASENRVAFKKHAQHVKIQQKKIISSLKKIEINLKDRNDQPDEYVK